MSTAQPRALTQSVQATSSQSVGNTIGQVFSDPNVVASIGQLGGTLFGAVTSAVGIPTGKTPQQLAAEAAAAEEKRKAEQTTMLIIGGGVAAVVLVIVIVVVMRRS